MIEKVGRYFAILLLVLVALNFIVVMSRYLLGIGQPALQELILYLHAVIFLGCAAWAYQNDEHVRVDIFYRDSPMSWKKRINFFGAIFLLLPTIMVTGFYSVDFVIASWEITEASTEPGGLPFVYFQKTILFLFPVFLSLAFIKEVVSGWK
jgi:TRAP-type mannitol/chloroaromatic compound transport system permease small subunit